MLNSTFPAHGHYQLFVENNMIIAEAEGPWNSELLALLHQEFKEKVSHVDINNYVVLVIPTGETLAVEEAMMEHGEFVKQGNAKAVAVDLSKSTTPLSSEAMFRKVYRVGKVKHAFFTNKNEAIAWLKLQMS